MFGFFVGTVCLIGLIGVLRRGRHHHHFGHSHGCGSEGWGGYGRARRRGFGFGPRAMLRRLFERLDTTPGQEKVIVEAFSDLKNSARDAKGGLREARHDLAEAFRQESFDELLLGGALSRLDGSVDTLRKAGLDAFGKVHAALDERQRKILADLIESGRGGFRSESPYRV